MSDTARFRRTGRWLLNHEAQGCESAADLAAAGARVLGQMQQGLTSLIGQSGARLLVMRALQAAQNQYEFLRAFQAGPEKDSGPGEPAAGVAGLEPDWICAGFSAAIAEALALLSDFIGPSLVLRQIRRIWPGLPLAEEPLAEEVGNEPA